MKHYFSWPIYILSLWTVCNVTLLFTILRTQFHEDHHLQVEIFHPDVNAPESATAAKTEKPRDSNLIYVITPTYPRMTQITDMTKLGQTLKVCLTMIGVKLFYLNRWLSKSAVIIYH